MKYEVAELYSTLYQGFLGEDISSVQHIVPRLSKTKDSTFTVSAFVQTPLSHTISF